jgi:hypothetical protein
MECARRNPVVNLALNPLLVLFLAPHLNHPLNADPDVLVNLCLLLKHANAVFVRMDHARRNPVVNHYPALLLNPLLVLFLAQHLNHPLDLLLNADPDVLVNPCLLLKHASTDFVRMDHVRRNPAVNHYLALALLLNHPLNAGPDVLVNQDLLLKHANAVFARMDHARRNPVVNHYLDLLLNPLLVPHLNHPLNADPDVLVNQDPLLVPHLNHPLNADPDVLVNQDLLLKNTPKDLVDV